MRELSDIGTERTHAAPAGARAGLDKTLAASAGSRASLNETPPVTAKHGSAAK